ncbi:hypoxia induced protein [Breoghania corrubedonensis]|uniref:Hypoxia induced protein n=1 Tax=Breoghania corrubedonensis TaxID=665038 RepID=A0A2T5VIC0_9HYPH|nr:twin transmembrane helix small protein [Breoghania corrubedonensis]PTW63507.1 hypoxia induced protein [Breoghania corrubedonensis]
MGQILYNLIPVGIGIVGLILIAGLFNMLRGGSPNVSQRLMRARVIAQALTIVLVLAAAYLIHGTG